MPRSPRAKPPSQRADLAVFPGKEPRRPHGRACHLLSAAPFGGMPMMRGMSKVVIVGAGASGLLHALAFRACGVEIEGVYDPDTERARLIVGSCGGVVLPSFEAAVSADARIAAVCSPPSVHVDQALALADAGSDRFVFVEKPIATTPDDLDRLRSAPRCIPIVQWRAGRAIRALRRAIAHGELGASPVASLDLAWGRDDAYLAARTTWGCGALLSIGIHAVDALAWAFNRKIEGVSGMATGRDGTRQAAPNTETAAVALFQFAGGALASLRISIDGGADTTRIAVCGRGITAQIDGPEADPTATCVRWSAFDERARERLEALERDTTGALGPPLLVPYIGSAVRALRAGALPGEHEHLPSIASTYDAHAAVMLAAAPDLVRAARASQQSEKVLMSAGVSDDDARREHARCA
jgi:predicted dehydrogenase